MRISVSRSFSGAGSILTQTGYVTGWAFYETSGTASAQVKFHPGTDASQPAILTVNLAANESARDFLPEPVEALNGLYVEVVSGTVAGNVYLLDGRNE